MSDLKGVMNAVEKLTKRRKRDLRWAYLGRLAAQRGVAADIALELIIAGRGKQPDKVRRYIFQKHYDLAMAGPEKTGEAESALPNNSTP